MSSQDLFKIKDKETNSIVSIKTIQFIRHLAVEYDIQGLSIALVKVSTELSNLSRDRCKNDKQCITIGKANAAGDRITPMSLFALGSNSKLFTAIALGMLIDRKIMLPDGSPLTWNTRMRDLLEDWKLKDEYASDHATLSDLLSMRSGLPTHVYAYSDRPADEVFREMRYLTPSAELREKWQYSNQGYIAIGQIFPILIGQTLVQFIQENVLDPLKMENTFYDHLQAEQTGRRTEGFVHPSSKGTDRHAGVKPESIGWFYRGDAFSVAACGGLVSCAKDMAIWTAELLQPKLIPSWIIDKVTQAHSIPNGRSIHSELGIETYGFGQYMNTYKGLKIVYHQDTLPGYNSLLVRVPDRRFGFAIMSNDSSSADLLEVISYRIIEDLSELPHTNWRTRLLEWEAETTSRSPTFAIPMADMEVSSIVQLKTIRTYKQEAYGKFHISPFDKEDLEHQEAIRCLPEGTMYRSSENNPPRVMVGKLDNYLAPLFVLINSADFRWIWTAVWIFDNVPRLGEKSSKVGMRHKSGECEMDGDSVKMCGWIESSIDALGEI